MQQSPYDSAPLTPRRNTGWIIALCVGGGCLVMSLAIVAVLGAILFPIFAQARRAALRTSFRSSCMSNGKQIGLALAMYAQDYDERLPPVAGWEDGLQPYIKNLAVYKCPERPGVVPAYAYNLLLDRRPLKQIQVPAQTPALFESSLGVQDAADRLESFVTPHRSSGGQQTGNVVFVDGHVKMFSRAPKATAGLAPSKPAGKPNRKGHGE